MPHLIAHLPDARLVGNETELVAALSEAIVGVYGEWARPLVGIRLAGVPAGRFVQGGVPVDAGASITLGVRAGLFDRPDAAELTARLGAALTDAVASVLGEEFRAGTMVELLASPPERTFVGGVLAS